MPEERTRAVRETRLFLETLLSSEDEIMWDLVRTVASQLLRHFPLDIDLSVSASALPGVWSSPQNARS
ncbi:BPSL0761 family protein [Paraburkholderia terrae]|uniref:BPSL0761 family protein n=1 Tax=Paraburkholderia terrae TaxID=311230 RepID=UPI003084579F